MIYILIACFALMLQWCGSYELVDTFPGHWPPAGCSADDCHHGLEANFTFLNLAPCETLVNSSTILKRSVSVIGKKKASEKDYTQSNRFNMERLFRKVIKEKENVNIIVLGGSFTAGRNSGGYDNAYPKILEGALNHNALGKMTTFNVFNHARGGTTIQWALQRLPALLSIDQSIDLIIIDYEVNNCAVLANSDKSRASYIASFEVLIRKILTFHPHTAIVSLNIATTHSGSMTSNCHIFSNCYSMKEVSASLLEAYGIPVVSQRDAIWSRFECPPPRGLWPCSRTCAHPTAAAHILTSNLLLGFLTTLSYQSEVCIQKLDLPFIVKSWGHLNIIATLADIAKHSTVIHPWQYIRPDKNATNAVTANHPLGLSLPSSSSSIKSLPFLHPDSENISRLVCDEFLTLYSSDSITDDQSTTNIATHHHRHNRSRTININDLIYRDYTGEIFRSDNNCWLFREDMKGNDKPGWVSNDCIGSSLYMKIRFGALPVLTVVALTSYTHIYGIAEVALLPVPSSFKEGTDFSSHLGEENDNFVTIGAIDSMIVASTSENLRVSLSTPTIFISSSKDNTWNKENDRGNTFFVDESTMKPNSEYIMRLKSVNATNPKWYAMGRSWRGATKPIGSKFKLMSVSSC